MINEIKSLPVIIKGDWKDKHDEVMNQKGNFVYINSNGSKWAGDELDDVSDLIEVMGKHKLDGERTYSRLNPCRGVENPNWHFGSSEERWIDGERLFKQEGVWTFHGNFEAISHIFCIYTNDHDTIQMIQEAIEKNK